MTRLTPLRATALAVSLALAFPAAAQTDPDAAPVYTAPVAKAIAAFEAAFTEGDMAGVLDAMPPTLLSHIATKFDTDRSGLLREMPATIEDAMAEVEMEAFDMDLTAAETGRTSEGRAYALVPTTSTMAIDGRGRFRSGNTTLALEEDGEWYLMRVDDPGQIALLREAYPDMAGIEFEEGTMEAVE